MEPGQLLVFDKNLYINQDNSHYFVPHKEIFVYLKSKPDGGEIFVYAQTLQSFHWMWLGRLVPIEEFDFVRNQFIENDLY